MKYMICFVLMMSVVAADEESATLLSDRGVPYIARKDYYVVEGDSTPRIIQSMRTRRYFEHNAYTEWYVRWGYSFLTEPDECRLRHFDVRVEIRFTLPQWEKSGNSTKAMSSEWNRYINAVVVHEHGHAQLGLDAGEEMQKRVSSQKWSAPNAKALRKKIDALCEQVVKKYRDREVVYDRKTDHGRIQGARLRPVPTR